MTCAVKNGTCKACVHNAGGELQVLSPAWRERQWWGCGQSDITKALGAKQRSEPSNLPQARGSNRRMQGRREA